MNKHDLDQLNIIQKRIDVLEEEVYALFEAQGKRINPINRIIKTISKTKKKNYSHDCEITLTLEDIKLLQDARLRELNFLKTIIKE